VKKGFKIIFEDNWCLIKDSKGIDVFIVKMIYKIHTITLMEEEQIDFLSTTTNVDL